MIEMDIKNGIFTGIFQYEDKDGISQKILLKPLKPDCLKDLIRVAKKFKGLKREQDESDESFSDKIMERLDDSTMSTMTMLCVEALKRSLPDTSLEDIESFVTSNFMQLFPIVIEMNLPNVQRK